jgi:hypothetical protein
MTLCADGCVLPCADISGVQLGGSLAACELDDRALGLEVGLSWPA